MEAEVSVDDPMSDEMIKQLRQWQQEQKNRLIEQQQQQRQILLDKQKKLLSMINNTGTENSIPGNFSANEQHNMYSESGIENQRGNNSPKFSVSSPTSVDDVPLKKPKAVCSFQQILENSISNKDQALTSQNSGHGKKFPFLKRGQGISRFGMISKSKTGRSTIPKNKLGKENKTPIESTVSNTQNFQTLETPEVSKTNQKKSSNLNSVESSGSVLNSFETISFKPTFSELVCPKPTSVESTQETKTMMQVVPFQQPKCDESLREPNSSRNEEDLAVFELLERFANINASFSSSSSLIGQLIDKGVTHLPSPSKVISFLSRKHTNFSPFSTEEVAIESERKSHKANRHVRFAVDEDQAIHPKEDYGQQWLPDISEEDISHSQPSPYISNTIRNQQPLNPTSSVQDRVDLDETPTSPIGFPDYQKLFGNPVRSLWTSEEHNSPTQDDCFLRNTNTPSSLSDPLVNQMKEAALPTSLPIEDPRVVYQTSLLRSRLTSLEREISNYRRETETMRRMRKEHEEAKQKLEQEQEKFRRYTENEKRRLQLLYSEEQKRVRAEQLKDLPQLKENEEELKQLRDKLNLAKEEHRQKENKWMASQTKVQEKIRALELRNRELSESLEKVRAEEQNLRRRLNASLRPGALGKSSRGETKNSPITEEKTHSPRPQSPQVALTAPAEILMVDCSPVQKDLTKVNEAKNLQISEKTNTGSSPGGGAISNTQLPDGTKLIVYPNGNRKEIWPDGKGTQVIYYNGDIKQKLADGSVVYTYADSGTKHTTKPDGTDILEFSSGQIETTYADGRSQVKYPGGAIKIKYPDGREDSELPDGTKLWTDGKGHGVMTFPSGIREIYTPICKRREYPDGTVKTVYEDGRSETRYSNGRIRVKDSAGNIITDTGEPATSK